MTLKDVVFANVGGLKTACVTREQLVDIIASQVDMVRERSASQPMVVFDSNGHGISLANSDKAFYEALTQADLIHADGQSVVSMSKWLGGVSIPERSATTDLMHDIPGRKGLTLSHFLLGGSENVVSQCGELLTKRYANFKLNGTHHGYFDKQNCDQLIAQINAAKPDILWVGLGKPEEQFWVIQHKDKLQVPVIITCGGCYNYVTGDYCRAPMWMQKAGIEWLHRLLTQPKKLFWRYLTTNPHSVYCVLKHKFRQTT
ncbi:WecB/TagA/CpsF family glycosyltransferase [Glaciecola siphonariae]|uniref:WecB/TagA/CpsF family glycosyltransferase n=1 Tax=Glaciecola siphonariae TaxID=521012 RepID=A0ABV9M1J3_9ALTE